MAIDDSSGSKDRATVALVLSKVETVAEKVDGHKELTKLGFENVQRQLDDVRGLPTKVAELEQTVEGVVARVDQMEKRWTGRLEFRRANLPLIVCAGIASVVSIIELVVKGLH